MSQDIRNLGTYANIAALWEAHPEGGREGDYATVSGTRYRWNKYDRIWENGATVTQTTGTRNHLVEGDQEVTGDMTVLGTLRAKHVKQPHMGMYASEEALLAALPTPEKGWYALVGNTLPAELYVCNTAGTWTDTGNEYDGEDVDLTNYVLASIFTGYAERGYKILGDATPSTIPSSPTKGDAYLASTAGTYSGFGGTTIAEGEMAMFKYNGSSWSASVLQVGKNYDADIRQINAGVGDLRSELVLSHYKEPAKESITGLGVTSNGIATKNTRTLYYLPISSGQKFIVIFELSTTSNISIDIGVTSGVPSLGATVSQYSYISTSVRKVVFTAESNGYFCFSCTTTALENLEIYTENTGFGAAMKTALEGIDYEFLKLNQKTIVGGNIAIEPEAESGLKVGQTSIDLAANNYLYFVPIAKGQTVRGNWSFASGYVRYGLTERYPEQGVSITSDYGNGGTGTKQKTLTAPENGYFVVSFEVEPSSILFSLENNGIGGNVAILEEKVSTVAGIVETVEGNGATSITKEVTVSAEKRYHLHLDNFQRGHTSGSYIVFRISIGGTALYTYYGTGIVPQDFYFETGEGETTVTLTIRQASGEVLYLRFAEVHNPPIFDYNDYNNQAVRLENAQKKLSSSAKSPFILLHFTDIHADSENLARLLGYYNTFKPKIDDIIHTGDSVKEKVNATSFDFWDEVPDTAQILNCIGNHDVWYADDYTPESNYPYNKYFKPYIDNNDWGTIVQPENAETNGLCYYYKDYASKGIRLVVLDYRSSADQVTWFASVLADAITNELSVIACIHYMPSAMTQGFKTPFDISPFVSYGSYLSSAWVDAVNTFIGNGGDFVCWLTGHAHRDYAGYYQGTNGRQVILSIDTAATRNDGNVKYRAKQSKSQDAFNIFSVNTHMKLITLWRVGNDRDALQRHLGSMCIDYANGELVYTGD